MIPFHQELAVHLIVIQLCIQIDRLYRSSIPRVKEKCYYDENLPRARYFESPALTQHQDRLMGEYLKHRIGVGSPLECSVAAGIALFNGCLWRKRA